MNGLAPCERPANICSSRLTSKTFRSKRDNSKPDRVATASITRDVTHCAGIDHQRTTTGRGRAVTWVTARRNRRFFVFIVREYICWDSAMHQYSVGTGRCTGLRPAQVILTRMIPCTTGRRSGDSALGDSSSKAANCRRRSSSGRVPNVHLLELRKGLAHYLMSGVGMILLPDRYIYIQILHPTARYRPTGSDRPNIRTSLPSTPFITSIVSGPSSNYCHEQWYLVNGRKTRGER